MKLLDLSQLLTSQHSCFPAVGAALPTSTLSLPAKIFFWLESLSHLKVVLIDLSQAWWADQARLLASAARPIYAAFRIIYFAS